MKKPIIYSAVDSLGGVVFSTSKFSELGQPRGTIARAVYATSVGRYFDDFIGDGPPFDGNEADAIQYLLGEDA